MVFGGGFVLGSLILLFCAAVICISFIVMDASLVIERRDLIHVASIQIVPLLAGVLICYRKKRYHTLFRVAW